MRRKEERSTQGQTYIHVHVLMRDEKEGRKKHARSNIFTCTCMCVSMSLHTQSCSIRGTDSCTHYVLRAAGVGQERASSATDSTGHSEINYTVYI